MERTDQERGKRIMRWRFIAFIVCSVILALVGIYDHIMVKLLAMFILVIVFWIFLKSHLRLKHDLEDCMKCTQEIVLTGNPLLRRTPLFSYFKVRGAYGDLSLKLSNKNQSLAQGDRLRVVFLPLSCAVLSWEKIS